VFSFDRLMGRIDYDDGAIDRGLAIHIQFTRRDVPRVPTRIYIIYGLSISLFKRLGKKIAAGRLRAQIRTQDKRMLHIIILYIVGRQGGKERTRVGT